MDLISLSRRAIVITSLVFVGFVLPHRAAAQSSRTCRIDRGMSTLVGAGLGAAAAAIPATIAHRHDQVSSHRIVAVSIGVGTLIGFVAAGHDRPCMAHADSSSSSVANTVVARRSTHAEHGAFAGAVIGGLLGAVGGTLYQTGCTRDPCHENATRVNLMLFSAGEGFVAGGLLGTLIGWAWPTGR